MEYIDTLIAKNAIEITPKDVPNKADLIKKGVDFTSKKPILIVNVPKGGAIIRAINIRSKNIKLVEIVFTNKYGRESEPIRAAPDNVPTDKFPTGKVTRFVIRIVETFDDEEARDVTLSVKACAEGAITTGTTKRELFLGGSYQ
jgi:hypothetical protein